MDLSEFEFETPSRRKNRDESVGVVSTVKVAGETSSATPDPRWPYLNRWTEKSSPPTAMSPGASMQTETKDTQPVEVKPSAKSSSPPPSDVNLLADPSLSTVSIPATTPFPDTSVSVSEGVPTLSEPAEKSRLAITEQVEVSISEGVFPSTDSVGIVLASQGKCSQAVKVPVAPLIGAWAKKLSFSHASIPIQAPSNEVQTGYWPSLSASQAVRNRKQKFSGTNAQHTPIDRMEDDIRFPWAAKMNPVSRNLYRATEPEYLEDGTPKVTIPQHVLLRGLENQKEYILGQFYRCSPPPGGLIYAVFNKLWGRKCRITIRKLGESNYLFHIPDESTRMWVLQRGLWHVDDCLMFVASWTPDATLAIPEIKTIPVWVTLKKIPNILYSIPGISHIASGLGAPMATHKPRLDPILMGEAKILVEVELSKAFPTKIAAGDESGFISMVDVDYAWLPTKCSKCGQLGHKIKRCLQIGTGSEVVVTATEIVTGNVSDVGIVSQEMSQVVVTATEVGIVMGSDSTFVLTISAAVTSPEVLPLKTIVLPINESFPIDPPSDNIVEEEHPTVRTDTSILETVESPLQEIAQNLSSQTPIRDLATVQRESAIQTEPCLGSNQFASFASTDGGEDLIDEDKEFDSMDFMTPSGKRILRERPVKPSTKAKEMDWQIMGGGGRGSRGRGKRGGRG